MRIRTDHKEHGGKLLRIRAEVKDGTIARIRITGDFFMHPEEKIADVEKILLGVKTSRIAEVLSEYLEKNRIEIIGFTPLTLQNAVKEAVKRQKTNLYP